MCSKSKPFINKNLNTRKVTQNLLANILATKKCNQQMLCIGRVLGWVSKLEGWLRARSKCNIRNSYINLFWQFIICQKMISSISGYKKGFRLSKFSIPNVLLNYKLHNFFPLKSRMYLSTDINNKFYKKIGNKWYEKVRTNGG